MIAARRLTASARHGPGFVVPPTPMRPQNEGERPSEIFGRVGREVGGLGRRWTIERAGQRKNDSAAPARHPHRRVEALPMMGVLRDQMRDPSPLRRHTALKWRTVRQKRQLRVFLETTRHAMGVVTISADERIRVDIGEPCGFPAALEPSEHFYTTLYVRFDGYTPANVLGSLAGSRLAPHALPRAYPSRSSVSGDFRPPARGCLAARPAFSCATIFSC